MKYWIILITMWAAAIMAEGAYAGTHLSKQVEGYEWGVATAMVLFCGHEIADSKYTDWQDSYDNQDESWNQGFGRFYNLWTTGVYTCDNLNTIAQDLSTIWEDYFEEGNSVG